VHEITGDQALNVRTRCFCSTVGLGTVTVLAASVHPLHVGSKFYDDSYWIWQRKTITVTTERILINM